MSCLVRGGGPKEIQTTAFNALKLLISWLRAVRKDGPLELGDKGVVGQNRPSKEEWSIAEIGQIVPRMRCCDRNMRRRLAE